MYDFVEEGIVKTGKDGQTQLTNFLARITEQTKYHDGTHTHTDLVIDGRVKGQPLPPITVPAKNFAAMTWVADLWGMEPIIFPQPNAERDVKTAIQLKSEPIKKDVYTHIGWDMINGKPTFLTSSGGIHTNGLNANLNVSLPPELQKFSLPNPDEATANDFLNTMLVTESGPSELMWTMFLTTIRPTMGTTDFAIHIAGKTGTYKTELASLFQSFYGVELDARSMPCSWSSTANALERQTYLTKNALVVVDDFVPYGTAYQVRILNKNADQLIRAQGNQAGRARMTDTSSLQQTFYPRGVIMSTGEDVPDGHSVRARMIIMELKPGDIETNFLTNMQRNRMSYSKIMARWIQHIASLGGPAKITKDLNKLKHNIRAKYKEVGHTRTPSIMADLIATAHAFSQWAIAAKFTTKENGAVMIAQATQAIEETGNAQAQYHLSTDPALAFVEVLRGLIASRLAHLRTRNGGIPVSPETLGWTQEQTSGEIPKYKAHGQKVGWIDWAEGELYLDPNVMTFITRNSQGRLTITQQTLIKRLKDEGVIARIDSARSRNTVRAVMEGHTRTVIVLATDRIFEEDSNPLD